jgi:hypothetical protein
MHVQPSLGAERLGRCAAGQTDSFCADQFGKPVIFAIVSTLVFGVSRWRWQVHRSKAEGAKPRLWLNGHDNVEKFLENLVQNST